ncbi:MAG TPA: YjbH domain-containing protein [Rhizomicrobium sp.]|nr:YjbH domain-containing protein [Rhizomicrobium sp.]
MASNQRRKDFARRLAAPGLVLAALSAVPSYADSDIRTDQPFPIRNMFGEVGLIDMPSAHMTEDGQIAVSVSATKDAQRYGFTFQVLPRLEGSFRYSHLSNYNDDDYNDRAFGMKLRLVEESVDWPDISLGLRDLLGTGVYGSEYLVASKHIFRDFDVTAGIGWGRLGSSGALPNPIGAIFPAAKVRQPPHETTQLDFSQLFRGPDIGLFGGVSWHTPIPNLDFLIEYSSDRYVQEKHFGMLDESIPVNFALAYRPISHVTLEAGFLYGTTYGLSLTIDADPTKPLEDARLGVPPPPAKTRTPEEQQAAIVNLSRHNVIAGNHPWLPQRYAGKDDRYALTDALSGMDATVWDYEIDGYTLLVNARKQPSSADCRSYARLPAVAGLNLRSVAVADLRAGDGHVVTCNVPKPGVQLASAAYPLSDAYAGQTPPPPLPRHISQRKVAENLVKDAREQSLYVDAVRQQNGELWIYFTNHHYYLEAEAVGRLSRIAMADASPDVEVFHFISVEHGLPLREIRIERSSLERTLAANGGIAEMKDAVSVLPAAMDNPALEATVPQRFPRFSWAISPETKQSLFDPNLPLEAQLLVGVTSSVDLYPGVTIQGKFDINIYNNFTDATPNDSTLPHVRSDIQQYYKHGINGIANLEANYRGRLAPDVFFKLSGGYLEDMFGGAGGQIVWRPENSRFTVGADLYEVWQRNFDRLISFQSYHVLTGHLSIYYESPWYGLNFNLHAGRYLAGDYGATFEIMRRFDSGVEIGGFVTLTDVPFKKFGEGSFDKGVIARIPLEWALPIHSQSAYTLTLRPLERDGGQRLDGDDSLYEETRKTGYGAFAHHLDDIPNP